MEWFLYDIGLRHESVGQIQNIEIKYLIGQKKVGQKLLNFWEVTEIMSD